MKDTFFKAIPAETLAKVKMFFTNQQTWMKMMIEAETPKDPFWRHASYIFSQFNGLMAGYQITVSPDKVWFVLTSPGAIVILPYQARFVVISPYLL
jgi:hypothetical protein